MEPLARGAEAFSFWTHAAGALGAVVLLVLLVQSADGGAATMGAAIYGASLVLLFASSAFHHTVGGRSPSWHAFSRRLDHIAIFLLIAGTYTPVCLLALDGAWRWAILGTVWSVALAGAVMKGFWIGMSRVLGVTLYLVMGWIVLVALWPLSLAVGTTGLLVLGAGGVAYSGGALIYANRRPDPWPQHVGFHGIWHLLVLVGAACHAAFIALWIL